MRNEAKRLVEMLRDAGIQIGGITPDLATEEIKKSKRFSLIKADEILLWLAEHPGNTWIVVDDLDLHNDEIAKHQIRTDSSNGLTMPDVEKARALFLGQLN